MDLASAPGAPTGTPARDDTIPVFARWIGSWQVSLRRRSFSAPELARSYDRAAARWNRMIGRLGYPRAYEDLLRGVLNDAPSVGSGSRLRALDCGVGTGALSCALARVAGTSLRLDALDISPRMLDEARDRLCEANLEATLRQGDVERLPYPDGAFDVVMAAHLLEHLPDPGAALAEMVRVVRPGGLVVVCLTRRTALGLYVHLKWRTHMVSPTQAEDWLLRAALQDVRCLSSGYRGVFRRTSIACVGTKPI